jgi:hypothetical protein
MLNTAMIPGVSNTTTPKKEEIKEFEEDEIMDYDFEIGYSTSTI